MTVEQGHATRKMERERRETGSQKEEEEGAEEETATHIYRERETFTLRTFHCND